jgi:hypothetical protein
MANDCDCKIRITGEAEDVSRLNKKLQCDEIQNNGSLHSGNYEILFESCDDVEDWGSKWQVFSNIDYSEGDTMMFIDGYSAWAPAEGLWQKISKDFNLNVEVEYSERGMNFAGVTEFSDGEESRRDEMTYWEYLYEYDSEYFWDNISEMCEWDSLDGIKESLGDFYYTLDDTEKDKISELHKELLSE